MNIEDRFWQKVHPEPNTGCWLWDGATNGYGYGRINLGKCGPGAGLISAHHFSWHLAGREMPDGLNLLHKCDVPACVNPDHLYLGSIADNNRDCRQKRRHISGWAKKNREKSACKHGHLFSAENTYFTKNGWRSCRKCHAIKQAEYRCDET